MKKRRLVAVNGQFTVEACSVCGKSSRVIECTTARGASASRAAKDANFHRSRARGIYTEILRSRAESHLCIRGIWELENNVLSAKFSGWDVGQVRAHIGYVEYIYGGVFFNVVARINF